MGRRDRRLRLVLDMTGAAIYAWILLFDLLAWFGIYEAAHALLGALS